MKKIKQASGMASPCSKFPLLSGEGREWSSMASPCHKANSLHNFPSPAKEKACPALVAGVAAGRMRFSRFNFHFSFLFILTSVSMSHAQQPLTIGDKLPDNITLQNIINPPEKGASIPLSSLRRGARGEAKLLILDFWATWCGPCIAMLPKTDSLQKVFQSDVQFLPLTYEPREKVEKLLSKSKKLSGITLPMAVNEQQLHALFPHKELPHYVWINAVGEVIAITGSQEVNAENIREILAHKTFELREKKDTFISYDREQPLLLANLGINKDQLYFESMLSGYVEGLPGRYDVVRNASGNITRITAINASLEMLYLLAWSNGTQYLGRNRAVYEVKDAEPIITSQTDKQKLSTWMREYSRCYELIVPDHLSKNVFQEMQQDLSAYFPQYKVSLEKRKRPCLVLVRTSSDDKMKTSGSPASFSFTHFEATMTNCSLDLLTAQLNAIYLQNLTTPIVNATGYTSNVDMFLDANLTDVQSLRKALQPYGLDLINKDQEIEVLLIRDSN